MRYEDMYAECESWRGEDGFCEVCTSCSGPAPSNLACDHPFPEGAEVYRGGRYGSCRFVIDGKPKEPESQPLVAWELDELLAGL